MRVLYNVMAIINAGLFWWALMRGDFSFATLAAVTLFACLYSAEV